RGECVAAVSGTPDGHRASELTLPSVDRTQRVAIDRANALAERLLESEGVGGEGSYSLPDSTQATIDNVTAAISGDPGTFSVARYTGVIGENVSESRAAVCGFVEPLALTTSEDVLVGGIEPESAD